MQMGDQTDIARDKAARADRGIELLAALLLSIAAFASSWAAFQAALWDGEQAQNYARAQEIQTNAGSRDVVENQAVALDVMVFTGWLDAYARDNGELQDFYRAHFRPQLAVTFDEWWALRPREHPSAPRSPFVMTSYQAHAHRTAALHRQAEESFAAGNRANQVSDAFVQATVIFALSLFLGGIIQSFSEHRVRLAMLAVGTLCLLVGMARILVLPSLSLGGMVTG
jgi:hypothetical protein